MPLLVGLVALTVVLAGCGSDDPGSATTTTSGDTTTTTAPPGLEQPAIWPAADVVFTTPEAAAEDFVTNVLDVPPALGEFKQGDSRSGEIDVLSLGEGSNAQAVVRSTLLLRQLGADDGWFIIGAVNEHETITSPASLAEVAAGPLEVTGAGRGFEANLVVTATVAGDEGAELDRAVTMGGSAEASEPYTVTLDLSDAPTGSTVMLLLRGGTGLETDPGEFSAIPVVITG